MNEDASVALALAFGALVTAIRKTGVSDDEVRRWLDTALSQYGRLNGEPART